MSNYQKFVQVLSKWPVDSTKIKRDYGNHLRELLKKAHCEGNVFPGTTEENFQMINSLMRLAEDKYKSKYPENIKFGATGLPLKDLQIALSDKFIKAYNEKKFVF